MYGLEAITKQNGWAMAVAGALIVMSGLTILSFVISQLQKVVAFLDKREERKKKKKDVLAQKKKIKAQKSLSPDLSRLNVEELAGLYQPMIDELGESFQLSELFKASQEDDLPHPHLSIRSLRETGVLKPLGDGIFSWNKQKENE